MAVRHIAIMVPVTKVTLPLLYRSPGAVIYKFVVTGKVIFSIEILNEVRCLFFMTAQQKH
jgi:hypothetical protein